METKDIHSSPPTLQEQFRSDTATPQRPLPKHWLSLLLPVVLLAGCYNPLSPALSTSELKRDGVTVTVKNLMVSKMSGMPGVALDGPEAYYASRPIQLSLQNSATQEVHSCAVNIQNPNSSKDRAASDSAVLETVCETPQASPDQAPVRFQCQPLADAPRDFSCVIRGLSSATAYSVHVSTEIDNWNIPKNEADMDSVSASTVFETLPAPAPILVLEGSASAPSTIELRPMRVASQGGGLEVGSALSLDNPQQSWSPAQAQAASYSPVQIQGYEQAPRFEDLIAGDYNGDGLEDLLAVGTEAPPVILQAQKGSAAYLRQDIHFETPLAQQYGQRIAQVRLEGQTYLAIADGPSQAVALYQLKRSTTTKGLSPYQASAVGVLGYSSEANTKPAGSAILSVALAPRQAHADPVSPAAPAGTQSPDLLLAIALKAPDNTLSYKACALNPELKHLGQCQSLSAEVALYQASQAQTTASAAQPQAWSSAKVLLRDFNGDGYTDVLQVREGKLQLGSASAAFSERNYLKANAPAHVRQDPALASLPQDESRYYDQDFLLGAPVLTDAYPTKSACAPDQLQSRFDAKLESDCTGQHPERIAPMYAAALKAGLAVGGQYQADKGHHAHRWQMLNTDAQAIDLDQDGDIDLITQVPSHGTYVYYNRGDGYFYPSRQPSINATTEAGADSRHNQLPLPRHLKARQIGHTTAVVALDEHSPQRWSTHAQTSGNAAQSALGELERHIHLHAEQVPEYLNTDYRALKTALQSGQLNSEDALKPIRQLALRLYNDKVIELAAKEGNRYPECTDLSAKSFEQVSQCARQVFGQDKDPLGLSKIDAREVTSGISQGIQLPEGWEGGSSPRTLNFSWKDYAYGQHVMDVAQKLIEDGVAHDVDQATLQRCASQGADHDNIELFHACFEIIQAYEGAAQVSLHDADTDAPNAIKATAGKSCWPLATTEGWPYNSAGIAQQGRLNNAGACQADPASGSTAQVRKYFTRSQAPAQVLSLDHGRQLMTYVRADGALQVAVGEMKQGQTRCYTLGSESEQDHLASCHWIWADPQLVWSTPYGPSLKELPEGAANVNHAAQTQAQAQQAQSAPVYACLDEGSGGTRPLTGQLVQNEEGWTCQTPKDSGIVLSNGTQTAHTFRVLISNHDREQKNDSRRQLEAGGGDGYKRVIFDESTSPALVNFTTWLRTLTGDKHTQGEGKIYLNESTRQWSVGVKHWPDQIVLNVSSGRPVIRFYNKDHNQDLNWVVAAAGGAVLNGEVDLLAGLKQRIKGQLTVNPVLSASYPVLTPSNKRMQLWLDPNGEVWRSSVKVRSLGTEMDVPRLMHLTDTTGLNLDDLSETEHRMVYRLVQCDSEQGVCTWSLDAVAMSYPQQEMFFVRDSDQNLQGLVSAGCLGSTQDKPTDTHWLKLNGAEHNLQWSRTSESLGFHLTEGVQWEHALRSPQLQCRQINHAVHAPAQISSRNLGAMENTRDPQWEFKRSHLLSTVFALAANSIETNGPKIERTITNFTEAAVDWFKGTVNDLFTKNRGYSSDRSELLSFYNTQANVYQQVEDMVRWFTGRGWTDQLVLDDANGKHEWYVINRGYEQAEKTGILIDGELFSDIGGNYVSFSVLEKIDAFIANLKIEINKNVLKSLAIDSFIKHGSIKWDEIFGVNRIFKQMRAEYPTVTDSVEEEVAEFIEAMSKDRGGSVKERLDLKRVCEICEIEDNWPLKTAQSTIIKRAFESYTEIGNIDWAYVLEDEFTNAGMLALTSVLMSNPEFEKEVTDAGGCDLTPLQGTHFEKVIVASVDDPCRLGVNEREAVAAGNAIGALLLEEGVESNPNNQEAVYNNANPKRNLGKNTYWDKTIDLENFAPSSEAYQKALQQSTPQFMSQDLNYVFNHAPRFRLQFNAAIDLEDAKSKWNLVQRQRYIDFDLNYRERTIINPRNVSASYSKLYNILYKKNYDIPKAPSKGGATISSDNSTSSTNATSTGSIISSGNSTNNTNVNSTGSVISSGNSTNSTNATSAGSIISSGNSTNNTNATSTGLVRSKDGVNYQYLDCDEPFYIKSEDTCSLFHRAGVIRIANKISYDWAAIHWFGRLARDFAAGKKLWRELPYRLDPEAGNQQRQRTEEECEFWRALKFALRVKDYSDSELRTRGQVDKSRADANNTGESTALDLKPWLNFVLYVTISDGYRFPTSGNEYAPVQKNNSLHIQLKYVPPRDGALEIKGKKKYLSTNWPKTNADEDGFRFNVNAQALGVPIALGYGMYQSYNCDGLVCAIAGVASGITLVSDVVYWFGNRSYEPNNAGSYKNPSGANAVADVLGACSFVFQYLWGEYMGNANYTQAGTWWSSFGIIDATIAPKNIDKLSSLYANRSFIRFWPLRLHGNLGRTGAALKTTYAENSDGS